MFDWLKRVFSSKPTTTADTTPATPADTTPAIPADTTPPSPGEKNNAAAAAKVGMSTKPCRKCGKMFSYDPTWEHIPNYCKDCKKKFQEEKGLVSRKCKECGKRFTFPKDLKHYPNFCRDCQRKRKSP